MCNARKSPPPAPPPPPPEAAPIQFGEKDKNTGTKNTQKVGTRRLQIPLTSEGGTTGLGIPNP